MLKGTTKLRTDAYEPLIIYAVTLDQILSVQSGKSVKAAAGRNTRLE
jgi:hypothetical protein